ncbi:MAG: carboxypeptidase regulatory-like domain-containing protein [Janthinobacterium lividum]
MRKAISKKLAFKLFAATASLGVTAAFLAGSAPAVYAAQVGGVQGTVKDAAGKAIQGAQVVLTPVGGGAFQSSRTDSSGFYSFAGLQPGNYTLQINVVTFNSVIQPISIVQDINGTLDFALTKKEITRQGGTVRLPLTKPLDTSTSQTVTATDEKREKSQPNNLYQSTGLLNFKAGVTTDAGQYPHVRGSDGNQVDWSIDGIDLRDPIFQEFATNLVTVGIRSSNVITGGASADYGGSAGAYLNQITTNGRDLVRPGKTFGGYIENTNGPGDKWKYEGGATNLGGILLDNKVDYALSSIVFKTHYGDNTQLGNLQSSHDEAGKFNYYADPNDTYTVYFAHGAENYNAYQTTPNSIFTDTDRVLTSTSGTRYISTRDLGSSFNDHSVQTYNLDHFTYKHNFGASSFLQYRIAQLHQGDPIHDEGTAGAFQFARTNMTSNQVDYYSQINKVNVLRAGLLYNDYKGSYLRQIFTGNPLDPTNTTSSSRLTDRTFAAYPQDFALYLADQLQAAQNKLVFNYGVRFQNTTFKLKSSEYLASQGISTPNGFTSKSTDPRLGLTYTPMQDLTFRSSLSYNSQRPDMRRIQRLGPTDVGDLPTATNDLAATAQDRSAANYGGAEGLASSFAGATSYNAVKLSHSHDFDLGFEKGLRAPSGLFQGAYSFGITGYNKWVNGMAFQTSSDYTNIASARATYDNEGTEKASGFEFTFRKLQRKPSDWNGYVNYTNQVVRANTSAFDVVYTPYFVSYLASSGAFTNSQLQTLARKQFSPSWDQRHTIGAVATKRINKLIESSFVLDAGSGLPFYPGSTSSGGGFFGSVGTGFAEINSSTTGNMASFTSVPITVGGGRLPSLNPVTGHTGWHYKISINTDFNLTPDFSLFLNVDNVFDKKTALNLATGTYSGEPYYTAPTAAYPQGQEGFQYQSKVTPTFLTFGFRQRF